MKGSSEIILSARAFYQPEPAAYHRLAECDLMPESRSQRVASSDRLNGTSGTNGSPKVLRCRCCLQPVHLFVQPDLKGYNAKTYVHCLNPDCKLYYATREFHNWLTMDLAQWDALQHPDWVSPVASP